ncbi:MAG: phosphonopyruvate decarboxylase [Rhodospirillales bacterium]|nr:phosphonopyruvate decarboxylase [Rhodospirillales bacterium]
MPSATSARRYTVAGKRAAAKISPPPAWADAIFDVLKEADIEQVGYVPDAGHTRLIDLCLADNAIRAILLTTEEEGVALLLGAWAGGQRGCLLMQSSGVGNCINMLSLAQECRYPFLMLVTMRGDWGEFNPWQVPMGQSTQTALESAGVIVQNVDDAKDVAETVHAAAALAFGSYRPVAVLIGQRIIGFKDWRKK